MNIKSYDEDFESREFVQLTRSAQYMMLISKQDNSYIERELLNSTFKY